MKRAQASSHVDVMQSSDIIAGEPEHAKFHHEKNNAPCNEVERTELTTDVSTEDGDKPSARDNKFKVIATWYTFFIFGLSDGTTGALLPTIQSYYNISYTVVSLLFLCQVLGYGAMSLSTQTLLDRSGRRWGSVVATALSCSGYILITPGTPFPVVVVAYTFLGFAAGIFEAMLNAWAGGLKEAAMVLGCLHGFYSLGAAISPIIATQMVEHGVVWHYYYAVLLGGAVLDMVLITVAFWDSTAQVMRAQQVKASALHFSDGPSTTKSESTTPTDSSLDPEPATTSAAAIKRSVRYEVFHSRFCIVGALYMLLYLGMEISTGGWLSQYLQKVRGAKETTAGFVNSGFWFGLTLGRFALSWPASHLLGEWWASQLFMALGLAFELVFWLAPGIIAPSIGVSLQGFWIGPIFPLIMELATRYLDPKLHVTAIGLIASFGSIGGALLPFIIGIAATSKGPRIVPYVLTALFAGCLIIWSFLPGREPIHFGARRQRGKA
jgi:fucose permease